MLSAAGAQLFGIGQPADKAPFSHHWATLLSPEACVGRHRYHHVPSRPSRFAAARHRPASAIELATRSELCAETGDHAGSSCSTQGQRGRPGRGPVSRQPGPVPVRADSWSRLKGTTPHTPPLPSPPYPLTRDPDIGSAASRRATNRPRTRRTPWRERRRLVRMWRVPPTGDRTAQSTGGSRVPTT